MADHAYQMFDQFDWSNWFLMYVCPRAWWVINQKKDKYIQNSLVVYTHGVYYLPIYKLAKSEQKKKKK